MSLIERIEQAEGPSRDLDAEIALAVKYADCRPRATDASPKHPIENRYGHGIEPPHYTSSIDAALMLVPQGAQLSYQNHGAGSPHGHMWLVSPNKRYVSGATPALALAAAALKAKEANDGK